MANGTNNKGMLHRALPKPVIIGVFVLLFVLLVAGILFPGSPNREDEARRIRALSDVRLLIYNVQQEGMELRKGAYFGGGEIVGTSKNEWPKDPYQVLLLAKDKSDLPDGYLSGVITENTEGALAAYIRDQSGVAPVYRELLDGYELSDESIQTEPNFASDTQEQFFFVVSPVE